MQIVSTIQNKFNLKNRSLKDVKGTKNDLKIKEAK